MFRELGAEVLDADATAREAVAVGAPAWQELRRLYGEEFFNPDGELNRSKVAQLVFADPEARGRLDASSTPGWPRNSRPGWRSWSAGRPLVLVEVPLLFEAGGRGPLTGSSWYGGPGGPNPAASGPGRPRGRRRSRASCRPSGPWRQGGPGRLRGGQRGPLAHPAAGEKNLGRIEKW